MLQDLTWDNYLKLNDEIRTSNFKIEYFSPVVIIQWQFYGLFFKFHQTKDFIVMYVNYTNNDKFNNQWVVYASYYKQEFNLTELKQVIKNDLNALNGCDDLNFVDLLDQTIQDWQLQAYEPIKSPYISNYIYELAKMKDFSGKKLQKKRNHLNAFLKQNYNITIKNFHDVNVNEIIDFCDYHIKKYAESYRAYEMDVYKQYLLHEAKKDKRYVGTVVYIDNKMVGFTFGFLNYDTFEVIIEKAERDIRGLYQYLIVSNIQYHDINIKYMDREDDAGVEELAKSKKSYYPLLMIERYCFLNVKNWY